MFEKLESANKYIQKYKKFDGNTIEILNQYGMILTNLLEDKFAFIYLNSPEMKDIAAKCRKNLSNLEEYLPIFPTYLFKRCKQYLMF